MSTLIKQTKLIFHRGYAYIEQQICRLLLRMTDFVKVVWIQVEHVHLNLGQTGKLGSNYRLSYDKHCLHRDRTGEDKKCFVTDETGPPLYAVDNDSYYTFH